VSSPEGVRHINDFRLIWCGPEDIPSEDRYTTPKPIHLNTLPENNNVYLKIENIYKKLAHEIPSILMDMLEIGSYVYCADQSISRGGPTWQKDGEKWRRNFRFNVAVRNPDLWNQTEVKEILENTLNFLSDDNFDFNFRKLTKEITYQQYFEFDEGQPWFEADSAIMFSGGLDSLSGAIQEIVCENKKTLLVSHRPVAKIHSRQTKLLSDFNKLTGKDNNDLHVPIWINKDSKLTKDTNQRTRSFLFTMLGATVAHMHGLNCLKFYENGIVSINLPIATQVVGARASRSTHPRALAGLSKLLSLLFDKDFTVENPFIWKTKTDIVKFIKSKKLTELIKSTNSCSHIRTTDKLHTHCGVCSQCIERRIATLYNKIGDNDPSEMYKTDLFQGKLEKPDHKTMVESYIMTAENYEDMNESAFFTKYTEIIDALKYMNLPTNEAAQRLYELHKRHGEQVCKVVRNMIKDNSELIQKGHVPQGSLLSIIVNRSVKRKRATEVITTFPTPEGATWKDVKIEVISDDCIKISVFAKKSKFTYSEIGFKDNRRGDFPDKNWYALLEFAKFNGAIYQHDNIDPELRQNLKKRVQVIRRRLKTLLQIEGEPFADYRKHRAYKLIPTISESPARQFSFHREISR